MQDARQDSFNVSPQQEQLWLAEPDGPSARVQLVVALDGPLQQAVLRGAVQAIVDRHESLRTTFERQPGIRVPLQVVHEQLPPAWRTADLRSVQAPAADLERLLGSELAEPLDHTNGPLMRALLVTLADDRHHLCLTLSGLAADASSVAPLLAELARHCGGSQPVVVQPLQYADFAEWQRELMTSEDADARDARAFWTRSAQDMGPAIPFADDVASASVPEQVLITLDRAAVDAVTDGAGRTGSTVPEFVHAAWHALLARVSGDGHFAVAFIATERRHADLEGAIGAFSRPVPIPRQIAPETSFDRSLAELRESLAHAGARSDYAVVDTAGITAGFVSYETYATRAGELDISLDRVVLSGDGVPLWLSCEAGDAQLRLRLQYDPARHQRGSVLRLAGQLSQLLRSAAADPARNVGELELLDADQRAQLLVQFNATQSPVVGQAVHELIEARSRATPGRTAVIDETDTISYGELDSRANQLAHRLRRAGVGPDVAVGLCTERSIGMVVGLLGILKAGGAYLPMHHEHPPARLAHQLTTAGARAVVTEDALRGSLPEFDGEIVAIDGDRAALDAEPATAPGVVVGSEHLVYVIYTSGSTGAPKGVGVTHGNLVNYATDIARRVGADSEPLAFGLVTSISTDLGNTSVFGALCSGGTLVLLSPAAAADPAQFAQRLQASPVDVLKITPSHVSALLAGDDRRVLPRRVLVLGGERAPWDLVERVGALGGCAILNHYGPTEATVGCCAMPVADDRGPYRPATVPIGRPLANVACYVLDDRQHPVALGTPGTLFVGGAGVARGYVGEPDLTAERFIADPFADAPDARLYDTGDLVRWLPDGTLEFLGRSDEQVKIRGYRVEPAEVESALRSHPQVQDAVVVARGTPARLIAYGVVDGAVAEGELEVHVAKWLPEYMLPSAIVTLDRLPRTPSGKVDRMSLPEPAQPVPRTGDHVAPRTPVEQAVTAMWTEVLGVEAVGVTDDFFELGGHSLLATQVVAQVRSDFAVELPLSSLFTSPTIQSLAQEIMNLMGASDEDETAQLMSELEGLSDEEVERLLAGEEASER